MNTIKRLKYVYIYVKKEKTIDCIKYGIKLSEYSNISFYNINTLKKGILAHISPKDSNKYFNEIYDILRIKTDTLNIFVHNSSIIENNKNIIYNYKSMCNLNDYELGTFINPELIICSTILPENIYKYNKIIDVPLLIDNSKELYLSKELEEINENNFNDLTFDKLKRLSK